MRWHLDDIDIKAKTLRLKATKNGRTHIVPMTAHVEAIAKRRIQDGTSWLFPAPRDPRKHVRGDALNAPFRETIAALNIPPATPHDLRRTFATGLARNGAPRLLIALALNHMIPGITSVYDRHGYEKEMRVIC
ncbi:MAG: tyrosine-type recombinase/integrase [Proteobacteria bacterium]|nr:tyrosine-type recombinase/integrase [Pseudomonadota bacterium]